MFFVLLYFLFLRRRERSSVWNVSPRETNAFNSMEVAGDREELFQWSGGDESLGGACSRANALRVSGDTEYVKFFCDVSQRGRTKEGGGNGETWELQEKHLFVLLVVHRVRCSR